jgi:hypothetical protein
MILQHFILEDYKVYENHLAILIVTSRDTIIDEVGSCQFLTLISTGIQSLFSFKSTRFFVTSNHASKNFRQILC